jgi:hypothetical protein
MKGKDLSASTDGPCKKNNMNYGESIYVLASAAEQKKYVPTGVTIMCPEQSRNDQEK